MFKFLIFLVPSISHAAAIDQSNTADILLLVGCVLMMGLGLLMGK